MSLGESIRSGVKWLAFGKIGGRLFEFAFGIALARLLVPADFGMIATIQIFTGFVGMFVAGGMGQSLIRAKEADADDFTAVFTLQLGVGLFVYLAFFFCAPLIASFFNEPLYTDLIRVSASSFLLRPLLTMRNAWLNREMNFKSRTLVDVATGFFGGATAVTLALLGLGVWSLVVSGLLGAMFNVFWLARVTPLRLRLNLDLAIMRKHAGFGAKIVGADFVNYVRGQSLILIMSKLAGPTMLGLFNKAESLSRLPNQVLMSPTMEPMFRAMSKSQDKLDQVKYLYYRAVTLLMAYTAPAYVLLWWIAEPFITVVYGPNWSAAGAPMSVLTLVGFFLNVTLPSSVLLAVRDRLGKEMLATAINIPIMVIGCVVGLRWGLVGAAYGLLIAQAVHATQLYALVLRAMPTRTSDLLRAVAPGLLLGAATFAFLAGVDWLIPDWQHTRPALYLTLMSLLGGAFAAAAFLWLPIPALRSESVRWRTFLADHMRLPIRGTEAVKFPPMFKKCLLWLTPLVLVLALLYGARANIAPHVQRLIAAEWRHFESDPLPVDTITQIYDMGVVDANNDGKLDLYTANHNYRQYLFVAGVDGRYRDVSGEWKLEQSPSLPGIEQSRTPPTFDRPGLYIYWLGDTLHLKLHGAENLAPVKGTLRLFNLATVVKNDGIQIRENVSKAGTLPETRIEFDAAKSGHLVLYLLSRGSPVRMRFDSPWARTATFVGRLSVVPQPYAGVPDAAAVQAADQCASCLEFEMTLLDRHSMAWSDFNRDGLPDIFINRGALGGMLRSFPSTVRAQVGDELLVSQSAGRFTERARALGIEKKDCSGRHVRWVDFDQDGRLDLFINCLERGTVAGAFSKQLWRQKPDGSFEDVAAKVQLDLPDAQFVDMVWFDADGDGRVDLFTHEDTGYYLYRMRGGVFARERVHVGPFHRSSVPGLRGNTNDYWQFDGKLSAMDFDADGDLDVFVASKRGNVLLVNEGGGRFRSVDPASLGLPAQSVAATWVDYDNDGRMDLHMVPEGLYRQDAAGRFHRTGLLALAAAKYQAAIVNWYDRDNDGDLDVVIALQENASMWRWWEKLYKSADVKGNDDRFDWKVLGWRNLTPSSASWLELELTGAGANPEAIGAHVVLTSAAGRQARQVGSHEGAYLSQGHYRLHFGLGAEKGPVSLQIRWPDGIRQTMPDVQVGQRLVMRQARP